jgi:hypothetical protein
MVNAANVEQPAPDLSISIDVRLSTDLSLHDGLSLDIGRSRSADWG